MSQIETDLTACLDEAAWEWLKPHAQRDVVICVAPPLGLVEVGAAIANDDTTAVNRWIGEQQIQKPTAAQLSDWNARPERRFQALIVQPYVLIQELAANDDRQSP